MMRASLTAALRYGKARFDCRAMPGFTDSMKGFEAHGEA
jgi:hypothetical protein